MTIILPPIVNFELTKDLRKSFKNGTIDPSVTVLAGTMNMKVTTNRTPFPENDLDLVEMFEIGGADSAAAQQKKARDMNLSIPGAIEGKLVDLLPTGKIVIRKDTSFKPG